jgi:FixJ family two-component response regulator
MDATIFLIDPDDRGRASLVWLLESSGFRVHAFVSAPAFLTAPGTGVRGCVLFDLGFPQRHGVRDYNELTASQVHLPVIVLTTDCSAAGPFAVPPFACLAKPVSDRVLVDCVRRALASPSAPPPEAEVFSCT